MIREQKFENSAVLAIKLASDIAEKLSRRIAENGRALLLVSGGSTPLVLFKHLSEKEIDWSKVVISLADERWVDASHCDSNEKLVKENLLRSKAAAATFLSLTSGHDSPVEGEAVVNERLRKLIEDEGYSIDVLVLGMGEDGHTASLFPRAKQLDQALDLAQQQYCVAITREDLTPPRLSLTAAFLLSAESLFLHIEGEKKKAVLESAMNRKDHESGQDNQALPIAVILNAYGKAYDTQGSDQESVSRFPKLNKGGEATLYYTNNR